MGKGGDGRQVPVKDGILKRISSSGKLKRISSVADDLLVLKSIWFNKASGDDHAERLENFYGPQAEACEHNRAKEQNFYFTCSYNQNSFPYMSFVIVHR